jgi:DNA-binding response OmpR family regulator
LARILLVDDDKDHLKLFTIILEEQGHSVDAYDDPDTALSKEVHVHHAHFKGLYNIVFQN